MARDPGQKERRRVSTGSKEGATRAPAQKTAPRAHQHEKGAARAPACRRASHVRAHEGKAAAVAARAKRWQAVHGAGKRSQHLPERPRGARGRCNLNLVERLLHGGRSRAARVDTRPRARRSPRRHRAPRRDAAAGWRAAAAIVRRRLRRSQLPTSWQRRDVRRRRRRAQVPAVNGGRRSRWSAGD